MSTTPHRKGNTTVGKERYSTRIREKLKINDKVRNSAKSSPRSNCWIWGKKKRRKLVRTGDC